MLSFCAPMGISIHWQRTRRLTVRIGGLLCGMPNCEHRGVEWGMHGPSCVKAFGMVVTSAINRVLPSGGGCSMGEGSCFPGDQ